MPNLRLSDLKAEIEANVRHALSEDLGSGDITAQLIPADRLAHARVITREDAVLCGTAWVNEVFRQIDPRVAVHWQAEDGQRVNADQTLFSLEGPARAPHSPFLAETGSWAQKAASQLASRPSSRARAETVGSTASKAAALHARMPRSFARLPPP